MHLKFLKEKEWPIMFCFHINYSFKLGPCFESSSGKNIPWLHRKQEGTSLMMFGHLNLAVWMLSVTSNLLINVNLMHLYKFRPCSMWIWEAQVLFEYASIPKNDKFLVCLISQMFLKKNRFVGSEDTWTMKDNSKKKRFRFCTSRAWYRYKYVTGISKYRTFTVHLRLILWMWASLIQKQYSCAGAQLCTSQGYAHHNLLSTAPC